MLDYEDIRDKKAGETAGRFNARVQASTNTQEAESRRIWLDWEVGAALTVPESFLFLGLSS